MRLNRISSYRDRRGFTLMELLIVVSIIAVLASLSAAVYFTAIESQKANNATSTVTRVQKALSTQYDAVRKEALREPLPPPASNSQLLQAYNSVLSVANNDPRLARVIWVKLRLRQAFPINFSEALNPIPFPSLYANQLSQAGITGSSSPPDSLESSACLLLALQRSVSGGVPVDQVTKLATLSLTTSAGVTIPALVDTFNQPLAFCRWPTGFINLNPNGAQPGLNDPEDPQGLLTNSNLYGTTQNPGPGDWVNAHLHATMANASFKLQPVIVSAGPDMKLGLDPVTFTQLSQDANDNIFANTNP